MNTQNSDAELNALRTGDDMYYIRKLREAEAERDWAYGALARARTIIADAAYHVMGDKELLRVLKQFDDLLEGKIK